MTPILSTLTNIEKNLIKFEDVKQDVDTYNSFNNPDIVCPLSALHLTNDLSLDIADIGKYNMSYWTKQQLSTLLGIRWNKWFDPTLVKNNQIQEEINKRFSEKKGLFKFRTTSLQESTINGNYNGTLRAILGKTYKPIDDRYIFERLEKSFKNQLEGLRFLKYDLTGRWATDRSSHYTLLGDPIDILENGKEIIFPGIYIQNSEVGYSALTIDAYYYRLVCLNGLIVNVSSSRLLYRQHRAIKDEVMDNQLSKVFTEIPVQWGEMRNLMSIGFKNSITDPLDRLETELKFFKVPMDFIKKVKLSYEKEPMPTIYGLTQAITRTAKESTLPIERFEYEKLGGKVFLRLFN